MSQHAFGTRLLFGDAATEAASTTFTKVAKIEDITPPTDEADDIEVTNHDSADKRKEYIPGLADTGEIEFECQFTAAQYAAIKALHRVIRGWRIIFPLAEGATQHAGFKCAGYVKTIGTAAPIDGVITAPITIKLSGVYSFLSTFTADQYEGGAAAALL